MRVGLAEAQPQPRPQPQAQSQSNRVMVKAQLTVLWKIVSCFGTHFAVFCTDLVTVLQLSTNVILNRCLNNKQGKAFYFIWVIFNVAFDGLLVLICMIQVVRAKPIKIQARTQGGGGVALGARAPPSTWKKSSTQKCPKEEKVPPRNVGKKECASSAQIRQN